MRIVLGTPEISDLDPALTALAQWQQEGAPLQLHPGDVGWFHRFGAADAAAAVRTWSDDDRLLAIGLLDGSTLLRVAINPVGQRDDGLAHQIATDVVDPARGVLPSGEVSVESPVGSRLGETLGERGWGVDEPWTILRRDLSEPVPDSALRVGVIDASTAQISVAVQVAAFEHSTFTEDGWSALSDCPAFAHARSLVGFDDADRAVAAVTVWSAGPGRAGIIEPMGVHRGHRRQGHGREIVLAAAQALRDLGASSAFVATPS